MTKTESKGKSKLSDEVQEAGVDTTVTGELEESKPVLHTFVDGKGAPVALGEREPGSGTKEWKVSQTTVTDNGNAYEFKHYVH